MVRDGKRGKKANVVKTTLLKISEEMFIMRACFYDEYDERSGEGITITGRWWNAYGQSEAPDSEWWRRWERRLG